MAVCIDCAADKPPSEFYAHPEMASGHVNVCKECHKTRMRARRRSNPYVQWYDRNRPNEAERKKKRAAYTQKWREENPLGYKAHSAVNYAIRSGKLKRLDCEMCGDAKSMAHHKDYSKPLDVIWLCAKCHNRLHALFPELEGKNKQASK